MFEPVDVVDFAAVERHVAAVVGAVPVDGAQCASLGAGGGAVGAADVDRHTVFAEDDGGDEPVAERAADAVGWDGDAVTGFADAVRVQPTGRGRLCIHDVGDVSFQWAFAVVAAGDEAAEGFGGEPVALVAPLEELGVAGAFTGCG